MKTIFIVTEESNSKDIILLVTSNIDKAIETYLNLEYLNRGEIIIWQNEKEVYRYGHNWDNTENFNETKECMLRVLKLYNEGNEDPRWVLREEWLKTNTKTI